MTISMREIAKTFETGELPYILPANYQSLKKVLDFLSEKDLTDDEVKIILGMVDADNNPISSLPVIVNGQETRVTTAMDLVQYMDKFVTYASNPAWKAIVDRWDTAYRRMLRTSFAVEVFAQNGNDPETISAAYDMVFPILPENPTDDELDNALQMSVDFITDWMDGKLLEQFDGFLEVHNFSLVTEVQEPAIELSVEATPAIEIPVTHIPTEEVTAEEPVQEVVAEEPVEEVVDEVTHALPVVVSTESEIAVSNVNLTQALQAAAEVMKSTATLMEALGALVEKK
jgi:hypothetical protein